MQYAGSGATAQRALSRRTLIATGGAAILAPSGFAAAPAGPPSFLARVVAVPDGRSLRIADGRIVLLPHILPPGPDRHHPMADTTPIRRAARHLADLTLAQEVRVDLASPSTDRWGNLRARVHIGGQDVAARLAADGMVRVFPEPEADAERIADLILNEARARIDGAGFWADGMFGIRDAAAYDVGSDRFETVRGTVLRVSRIGARWHLEFGPDWRTDFTAGVQRRLVRPLTDTGIDMENLIGARVDLRGWVRFWNGPFMEVTQTAQISRTPS